MSRDAILQRLWYDSPLPVGLRLLWLLLLPLSALFALISSLRRQGYRLGLLASHRVGKPVIVVGNISVGGTGKTPLVIWLAAALQTRGRRVGIVTRGYGGNAPSWPRVVTTESSAAEVGDEPVMMAARTAAIVVAGPDRVAAAQLAIDNGADVILSDDGLQHYRLRRDCEIAVIDAQRAFGNRWLLPAGPLRESAARLRCVDLTVRTVRDATVADAPIASGAPTITTRMKLLDATALVGGERRSLHDFRGRQIHAVAAIGNPQAFFTALRREGLEIIAHPLRDHATLAIRDVTFADDAPVLMTEKDAVKCRTFAQAQHWSVRMTLEMSDLDAATIQRVVDQTLQRCATAR